MIDVPVVRSSKFSGAHVEKTAELPQMQLVEALDKVVDMPVVCNDRCRGVQFIKVVDVPVIMRVEVPQIQFIADLVDIPPRNRDRYSAWRLWRR